MTNVQQNVSGYFRPEDCARTFCLTRSYLLTCQKNDVEPGEALALLFRGEWPRFFQEKFDLIAESAE